MVERNNVGMVVTVAHKIGHDCCEYLPLQKEGEVLELKEHKITLQSLEQERYLTKRTLLVENSETGYEKELTHYHFSGWPDFELPKDRSEKTLNKVLDIAVAYVTKNAAEKVKEKLLVHCRAGMGRTGTFTTLLQSCIVVNSQLARGVKDPVLSIFSIVRRQRMQRCYFCNEDDQHEFIYHMLNKKYLEKSLEQDSEVKESG